MARPYFEFVVVGRRCMMEEDRHIDKGILVYTSVEATVDTGTFSQTV
jgi:hypothetical protein